MIKQLVEKFIFYPEKSHDFHPNDFNLPYQDVYFDTEDGVRLHGWLFLQEQSQTLPTLLFFHGNAGNISHRLENVDYLFKKGMNLFIIDYRGYGNSQGSPTEDGVYRDALASYQVLSNRQDIDPEKIVVFGRSLGGAIAIDLVSKGVNIKGLIVESTFSNASDLAGLILPIAGDLIAKSIFDSLQKAKKIEVPVLQFHGTKDEIIPYNLGEKLFRNFNEPKEFYPIEGASHNDTYLRGGDRYFSKIADFVFKVIQPKI